MASIGGFVLANIAYQAFGALWYSPLILGRQWQKLAFGTKGMPQQLKDDTTPFFFSILLGVISSIFLNILQVNGGVDTLDGAALMGGLVGGIFACHSVIGGAFKFVPRTLTAIDASQVFMSIIIMSVTLCYFRA